MYSGRRKNSEKDHRNRKSSKENKLSKLIESEDDTDEGNAHELTHYLDDRVKLMKEVLKIIKPKKIKSMAPDCMKNMDLQEINSMLLEELLGISNKRLKYIFEGKVLDEESSTDEDQPIDVISLDDISEDDFVVISDDETDKRKQKQKRKKVKDESKDKSKKIKKEKENSKDIQKIKQKLSRKETITSKDKETIGEENLMSVLELLELQARARAIKSQLELENKRKLEELAKEKAQENRNSNEEDDEEIIMEVPKEVEIVITSSGSENEEEKASPSKQSQSEIITQKTISTVDESSQESQAIEIQNYVTTTEIVQENNHENGNLEEGEISVNEIAKNIPKENVNDNTEKNKEANLSDKSDSDSESCSDDTLQVIKERERRRERYKNLKNKNSDKKTKENNKTTMKGTINKTAVGSNIANAVEEFMKTQPPSPDNTEDLKKIEENKQKKIQKDKLTKLFKSKLQSFKQDVAVEMCSDSINVLENIVIKPREDNDNSHKSVEDSDDLVINIGQDDIDCIICD